MPRPLVLVLATVAAMAFAACDDDVDDGVSSERTTPIVADLCQAAEVAAGGDLDGAGDRFADGHGELHDLAARLGHDDEGRAAAAAVLEAKQRVEADLAEQPAVAPAQLAGDLRALATVVAGSKGGRVPDRCA